MTDGLNVVFPDYKVKMPFGNINLPLGHGIGVAIDPMSGRTRGSEYGRYTKYGKAKRVPVPDFRKASNGEYYTDKELEEYEKLLLHSYQKLMGASKVGNNINIDYQRGVPYETIVKNMQKAESSKFPQSYGFFYDGHNCGTYSDVISKGDNPTIGSFFHLPITPNGRMYINKTLNPKNLMPVPMFSETGVLNPIYK